MPIKIQAVIDKINIKIKDFNNKKYKIDEKIGAINDAFSKYLSGEIMSYARIGEINMVRGQDTYQYPEDWIENKQAYWVGFNKQAIFKSVFSDSYVNYFDLLNNLRRGFIDTELALYSERVSVNEFEVLPQIEVDKIRTSATLHEGDLPASANEKDIWVKDNGEYLFNENAYVASAPATLTVPAERRPDVALVFTAITVETSYINIEILDGGASGVTSLLKSGSGTSADPYLYQFTTYDDNNSNNNIIATLSGDPDLTASGASATIDDIEAIGVSTLINPHESEWQNFRIELHYKAVLPTFNSVDDFLPTEMQALLANGDAIASLSASELLRDDKPQEAQAQMLYGKDVLDKAMYHYKKSKLPRKARLRSFYRDRGR